MQTRCRAFQIGVPNSGDRKRVQKQPQLSHLRERHFIEVHGSYSDEAVSADSPGSETPPRAIPIPFPSFTPVPPREGAAFGATAEVHTQRSTLPILGPTTMLNQLGLEALAD